MYLLTACKVAPQKAYFKLELLQYWKACSCCAGKGYLTVYCYTVYKMKTKIRFSQKILLLINFSGYGTALIAIRFCVQHQKSTNYRPDVNFLTANASCALFQRNFILLTYHCDKSK